MRYMDKWNLCVYCAVRTVLCPMTLVHLNSERDTRRALQRRERHKKRHETRQGTGDFTRLNSYPPGVLATKVGYFGVKSTKVPQGQMGT